MRLVLLDSNLTLLTPKVQTQLSLASSLIGYKVSWNDYIMLNGSELWLDQRFGGISTLEAFLVSTLLLAVGKQGELRRGGGGGEEMVLELLNNDL